MAGRAIIAGAGSGRVWVALAMAIGVVVAAAVSACSDEESPPPEITEASATRDNVNGAAGITSTVVVRFARGVEPAESEVPLASHFEIVVPDAFDEDESHLVFPRDARQVESDERIFELGVGTLVPEGSRVRVSGRMFGKDQPDLDAEIVSDVSPLQALLATAALGPTDPAIIDEGGFPEPTEEDRDRASMRVALIEHLEARQSGGDVIGLALSRFDNMSEEVVPSPKLRAAIAALTGTFAESAIDQLLTEQNCVGLPAALIAFQDPPEAPELFARVTHEEDGARIVSISPRLEGEPLELLIPLIAHEAIHCDPFSSIEEEVAATAFDTLLYMQMLVAFPDLARHGSPLSKDLNLDAIAMINSGRALPESVGVLQSPGVTRALPNTSAEYASFVELVGNVYLGLSLTSPLEPLAAAYAGVFAAGVGIPGGDPFDLQYLDSVLGFAIDPRALLVVIGTLGLEPVG